MHPAGQEILRTGTLVVSLVHKGRMALLERQQVLPIGARVQCIPQATIQRHDIWTVDSEVRGVIAAGLWTLRRGGWMGTANSIWSPWTPTTTSIANAPILLLLTPVHGF